MGDGEQRRGRLKRREEKRGLREGTEERES